MQGILFTEILYNRTRDDMKKQTRRTGGLEGVNNDPDEWTIVSQVLTRTNGRNIIHFTHTQKFVGETCQAKYAIGEIIYIKEPLIVTTSGKVIYQYDQIGDTSNVKWSNKMFMGEKYAREFLLITNITCERLFDISEDDCIAEGIETHVIGGKTTYHDYMGKTRFSSLQTPKESFFSLYAFANKRSKKKTGENPWCWKYEFERVSKP